MQGEVMGGIVRGNGMRKAWKRDGEKSGLSKQYRNRNHASCKLGSTIKQKRNPTKLVGFASSLRDAQEGVPFPGGRLEFDLRPQDERAACRLSERAEKASTRIEWVGVGGSRIVVVEDVLSLGAQSQSAAVQVKV